MVCHDQFCQGATSDGAATICQHREAFAFIFVLNFHNNPVKYVLSQFAYVEAESQKADCFKAAWLFSISIRIPRALGHLFLPCLSLVYGRFPSLSTV